MKSASTKTRSRAAAAAWLLGHAIAASGFEIEAITAANKLVRFDSRSPETTAALSITGLGAGETVVAIDVRPANQALYILTRDGAGAAYLYTLARLTGAATLVGAVPGLTLDGSKFAMDFNPLVDRIRVVSDSGQNLRINPLTAAFSVDVALNPGTPHVVAIAYANAYAGAASTKLYDIDAASDTLLVQVNPNGGTLEPVGELGFDTGDAVGFDIVSYGSFNVAYATLTVGGVTGLYTIVLETGVAGFVGAVGGGYVITGAAIYPELIFTDGFD